MIGGGERGGGVVVRVLKFLQGSLLVSLCCKSLVVDYSMSDGDGKRDLGCVDGDSFRLALSSKVSSGYILRAIRYSFKSYMFFLLIL